MMSESKEANEISPPSPGPKSEAQEDLSPSLSSPFRRSTRKRMTTRRYSSHDFRPTTDEEDTVVTPRTKRRKRGDGTEKRVTFKSPPYSPKCAESADNGHDDTSGSQSVELETKQKELEELRSSSMNAIRQNKTISRQEVIKERARLRDEAQKRRQEEKQKIVVEKARLREAKKLNKLATQEKLKLARNLLREAQKDARKRQKEREKVRKQQELHLLKEKRQAEKRKKQELTSVPLVRASDEVIGIPLRLISYWVFCTHICVNIILCNNPSRGSYCVSNNNC